MIVGAALRGRPYVRIRSVGAATEGRPYSLTRGVRSSVRPMRWNISSAISFFVSPEMSRAASANFAGDNFSVARNCERNCFEIALR